MGDLLCDQNTPNRPIRHRWKSRLALARLNICRRGALSISNWAKVLPSQRYSVPNLASQMRVRFPG